MFKLQKVLREAKNLMGNFINGGTRRGEAFGFKISSLTKLTDTKTTNNKMNLLQYIVQVIERKCPHLLNFYEDLESCAMAAKVSTPTLEADIASLNKEFKKVESIVENIEPGKWRNSMGKFMPKATESLGRINRDFKKMDTYYKKVAAYFAEDSKTPAEEFFGMIHRFCQDFQSAKKQNELLAMQKKEKQREKLPRKRGKKI